MSSALAVRAPDAIERADALQAAEALLARLKVNPLVVESAEQNAALEALATELHAVWKVEDAERKAAKAPHLAAGDAVDAERMPRCKTLETAYKALTGASAGFLARVVADRARANAAALQADGSGDTAAIVRAGAAVQGLASVNTAGLQSRWTFRVTEPEKVPREYCAPDQDALDSLGAGVGPEAPPAPVAGGEWELVARTRVKGRGRK